MYESARQTLASRDPGRKMEAMDVSDLALAVKQELKRIMVEEGVSQNELGRRTGIAQSDLSKLFREEREVTTATIETIAVALRMVPRIVFEPAAAHSNVA